MHLAIDAVGMKQAGVKTILLDVLTAVEEDDRIERATVFSSPREVRTFDIPASRKVREVPQPKAEHSLLRFWWYERWLPQRVQEVSADVLLCLHDAGVSPSGIPHATFIQRPLRYAEDARRRVPFRARYRMPIIRKAIRHSCRSAGAIFVHTPTERRYLTALFDIPEERVEVVLPPPRPLPNGEGRSPELDAMRSVPEGRRVLFVGQLFGHKNLQVVVEAMPKLLPHLPGVTLFVSGPLEEQPPETPGVIYLGAVADASLREAYELATILVMPSLHETIGLPMPEAMSVGTPVLAADRPYAHDVCEDAAVFFDPLSPSSCAGGMLRLLQDPDLRSDLSQRGLGLVRRRREARPYHTMLTNTLALVSAEG